MVSKSRRRRLAREKAAQAAQPQPKPAAMKKKTGPSKRKKGSSPKGMSSSFAGCVLNPFGSVGMVAGVPDRYDGLSVMIENTTVANVRAWAKGGRINLLVAPVFGANLFGFALDGDSLPDITSGNGNWVSANIGPADAEKFSQFRTVSLAVKVTYVGKAVDASGSIMACQCPLSVGAPVLYRPAAIAAGSGTSSPTCSMAECVVDDFDKDLTECEGIIGSSTTARNLLNSLRRRVAESRALIRQGAGKPALHLNGLMYRRILPPSCTQTVILAEPDSIMVQASRGVTCVAKHTTGDSWNFTEMDSTRFVLGFSDFYYNPQPGSIEPPILPKDGYFSGGEYLGVDPNVNGILLSLSDLSDASFVVEVRHCIEAVPRVGDGLYRSLARPSPPLDRSALDRVTDVQRKLPTGSAGDSVNWGNLVSKALSGVDVGKVIKGLGHMVLGPVSGLLDAFM